VLIYANYLEIIVYRRLKFDSGSVLNFDAATTLFVTIAMKPMLILTQVLPQNEECY